MISIVVLTLVLYHYNTLVLYIREYISIISIMSTQK